MASLQWTAVAFLLYAEIGITFLMCLGLLKPWIWKKIFGVFRVFEPIKPYMNIAYFAVLVILILLFADSLREMYKFREGSTSSLVPEQHEQELNRHMKEFRAQRNFYIAGFTLFLFVVIRRLVILISQVAQLEASNAALESQARGQSAQLLQRMSNEAAAEGKDKGKKTGVQKTTTDATGEGPSKEEYDALKRELELAQKDMAAMKRQAESTAAEYDRLSSDYQKLQQAQEGNGSKKDQ